MLHILAFLVLVVLVYLGMQYYVAFWLIRSFPGLPLPPASVRCAILLLAFLFPLSIYWLRHGGAPAQWLASAMYVWTGVLLIWLFWAACGDLLALIARRLGAGAPLQGAIAWAVVTATVLSAVHAYWSARRPPAVTAVEVALPRLPKGLDGFTVVQLSDLHIGLTVPVERFEAIVGQVNALSPDLVVLTGDLMDPGPIPEERVAAACAGLKARHGTLAVLGNHEFYHGLGKALEFHQRCGARLLRSEVAVLPGGLQVAGVDDLMAGRVSREEVDAVLSRLDPKSPSLFLSHQPRMFDLASERGVGLMLSGHTHSGQIFPFGLVVRLSYRYVYGLYRLGGSALYVTSGAGQWGPPMRFLTRTEIVRIVLRSPD
ncbi:MAG: metallophosphoesterase [Elusimicrobia bacterium]|nr:metallophosphoesterase [Elusimicrobiota bacterium]